MLRRPVSWLTSAALILGTAPMPLQAQQMVPKGAPSMQAPEPVQSAQPDAPEQPQAAIYSPEQLDAILAPIALYPDVLLTQVLMASGFPLQLIEAARWVQANRGVTGQALERALANRNWDPSVKSLVPFPAVLTQMTGNLEWLQDLGVAALQQQPDVLDSVQRLRQRAEAAGNLRSSPQQVVRTEERYIYIEPAQPEVVYVPAYNPVETYGTWAYPAYPPVYLPPPPGYGWGNVVGPVLLFGAGVAVGATLWNLGRPRWGSRHIYVDHYRYNRINVNRPPFRGDVWHPANTNTFHRAGLGNPPGRVGGPGHGPGWNNPPGAVGGPGAGPRWGGHQGGQGGNQGLGGQQGGGSQWQGNRGQGGGGSQWQGNRGQGQGGQGQGGQGQGGGGSQWQGNRGQGQGQVGQGAVGQGAGGGQGQGGGGSQWQGNRGQGQGGQGAGGQGAGGGQGQGGGGSQWQGNRGQGQGQVGQGAVGQGAGGGQGGGGSQWQGNRGHGGGGGGGQFRGQGGGGGAGAVGMPSGGGGHGGGGHGGGGGQFRSQGGGGGASMGMPSGGGGNRGGGGGGGGGGGHNQRRNNN